MSIHPTKDRLLFPLFWSQFGLMLSWFDLKIIGSCISVNPYFSVVLQVQNMMYGFWSEITLSIAGCVIPFFCKCPVSAHTILSANLEYRLHPGYCQQCPCLLLPFCMHSKYYLQARTCRGHGGNAPQMKNFAWFCPSIRIIKLEIYIAK